MKEDLLKIIDTYGVMPQLKYFQSEVFELGEAIIKERNTNYFGRGYDYVDDIDHIKEEIADVTVMLKQFQHYYGISDEEIEEVMKFKVERTIKRMENEYYEK